MDKLLDSATRRNALDTFSPTQNQLQEPLDDVAALVETGLYTSASKRFGELRHAAERHARDEEHFLFPFVSADLEPKVGLLRAEHRKVADSIDRLSSALSAWEQDRCQTLINELRSRLDDLRLAEEQWLHQLVEGQVTH